MSPAVLAAQAVVIAGKVTDAGTGAGIPNVQVSVVGTNAGAFSNDEGHYVIRTAPTGTLTLRAIRIGYEEKKQSVNVSAGQAVTADFAMRAAPVNLSPVVTTAAGATTRREEVGHTDYSFDAAKAVDESDRQHDGLAHRARTECAGAQLDNHRWWCARPNPRHQLAVAE